MGSRRSTPKRQNQGRGQGLEPRSSKGQGAGEPAQIALCVCAKSSSRCSDGWPEYLSLAEHCRKRGRSEAGIRTGRSDQERVTQGDRRPSRMASSPGRNPGSVGGNGLSSGVGARTGVSLGTKEAGMTRRRRPPIERSNPPRTKSRQRQGRTRQIKRVSSRMFCSGTRLLGQDGQTVRHWKGRGMLGQCKPGHLCQGVQFLFSPRRGTVTTTPTPQAKGGNGLVAFMLRVAEGLGVL